MRGLLSEHITANTETDKISTPRFRHIPRFGNGTIRRIRKDVSGLKKMAAHDYGELLVVGPHVGPDNLWIPG